MLNISDNELDRLSREAADLYQPDLGSGPSWDKLAQQLDQELGKAPRPAVRKGGYTTWNLGRIGLLVMGLAASFLLYRLDIRGKAQGVQNTVPAGALHKTVDQASTTGTEGNAQRAAGSGRASEPTSNVAKGVVQPGQFKSADNLGSADLSKPTSSAGSNRQTLSQRRSTAGLGTAPIAEGSKVESHSLAAGHSQMTSSSKGPAEAGPIDHGRTAAATPAQPDRTTVSQQKNSHDAAKPEPRPAQVPNAVAPIAVSLGGYAISLGTMAANPHLVAGSEIAKPNYPPSRAMHINRSLKIGVLAAPDYSDVHTAPNNKLSSNFGLTISYSFLAKWWLNTGLIYTQKNYGVGESDFKALSSAAYVPLGCEIEYINGTCYMLEIPLTLRRDFRIASKTTFFVNAGLSSYIMQNEDYVVHYSPVAGYWGPSVSGQSTGQMAPHAQRNFWFSAASLSAGIEQDISKSISFQVEPFAKLPLRGIGMGNIQLSSYGIAFSVRYAPVLGRTRK
jgi:hypothetical protein